MISQVEILALVEILNRAPTSQAEKLWLQGLINELQKLVVERPPAPEE